MFPTQAKLRLEWGTQMLLWVTVEIRHSHPSRKRRAKDGAPGGQGSGLREQGFVLIEANRRSFALLRMTKKKCRFLRFPPACEHRACRGPRFVRCARFGRNDNRAGECAPTQAKGGLEWATWGPNRVVVRTPGMGAL